MKNIIREINPAAASVLKLVRECLDPDQTLYLVGGAVRDYFLGRPLHDLDFVMPNNPAPLARRVANRLRAGFFMLDDDRHTARVVHQLPERGSFPLDFVRFTGESLGEDLRRRDFTLNALAVDIRNMDSLIDPLGGVEDLKSGVLRACGPEVILTDPVRALRGIRQAMQFGFRIEEDTRQQMVEAAARLPLTSIERQRDELFKILEGPEPAQGIDLCRQFGVFNTMIPELVEQTAISASPPHVYPLWEHTVRAVGAYKTLLDLLLTPREEPLWDDWWLAETRAVLGEYGPKLSAYFSETIAPERTRIGLSLFGTLLHDMGKPTTMTVGEDARLHYYNHDVVGSETARRTANHLALSNAEADWVGILVRHHMRLLPLTHQETPPSRRMIYRYYQKTGEVGVAISLLSLADTLATYGPTLKKALWARTLQVTRTLMVAWWEGKDKVVNPPLFLDGNDLQTLFGLKPGRQIGRLLSWLAEAQAGGEVETVDEAKAFISDKLTKGDETED